MVQEYEFWLGIPNSKLFMKHKWKEAEDAYWNRDVT
jgi:hypothetical protein